MTEQTGTKDRTKRRGARIELAKSIILAALFVSMVILASAEIVQTQRLSISPAVDVDIESLLVLYGDRTTDTIATYILPEFMGYKINGVSRGMYGGESSMREFYGLLDDFISGVLGDGCVCQTLHADEGERIWDTCRSDNYIYVRYFSQLPASALYCAASGVNGGALAEGNIPYIRELFITLDVSGDTAGYKFVTRSESGEISVYTPKDGADLPDFDISAFTAYNNSSQLADFSFLGDLTAAGDSEGVETGENVGTDGDEAADSAAGGSVGAMTDTGSGLGDGGALSGILGLTEYYSLPDTTVLTEGEFTQKYITVNTGAALAGQLVNEDTVSALLDLFDINANHVDPYESKGYTIYLGESGRLRLSETGGFDYTAVSSDDSRPSGNSVSSGDSMSSGGVAVSSFLGYENYGGNYTYYELLTAAASLLGSVKDIVPTLLGGDAQPELVSISGGETGLELIFEYFYDNYNIAGLDPAVTVTFSKGKLTQLTLTPADITAGELCVSIPQSWAVSRLYDDVLESGAVPDEPPAAELAVVYSVANYELTEIKPDENVPGGAEPDADTDTDDETAAEETADQSEIKTESDTKGATDEQTSAIKTEPVAPDWAILTTAGDSGLQ